MLEVFSCVNLQFVCPLQWNVCFAHFLIRLFDVQLLSFESSLHIRIQVLCWAHGLQRFSHSLQLVFHCLSCSSQGLCREKVMEMFLLSVYNWLLVWFHCSWRKTFCMISVLIKILRFVFCPRICSVFDICSMGTWKNLYSAVTGWSCL